MFGRFHLACLCLVASILAHALAPTGQALERHSGSAFSATTWEVSLGPARSGEPVLLREQHRAQGAPGGPDSAIIATAATAARPGNAGGAASAPAELPAPRLPAPPGLLPQARAPPMA